MPHWAAMPKLSLGFMSRIPIAHYEWHRPRLSRHAFLEIVPEGMSFRVFGVHLSAVFAAWTERRRVIELRSLLHSIKQHQDGVPRAGRGLQHRRARRAARLRVAAAESARDGLAERRADPLADDPDRARRRATSMPSARCTPPTRA